MTGAAVSGKLKKVYIDKEGFWIKISQNFKSQNGGKFANLITEFTKNLVTLLFRLDFAGLITEVTKKSGHFIV